MAEKPVVTDEDIQTTLADLEQARQSLSEALMQLKNRRSINPFNLQGLVERHPIESVLGAAALGFILAQPPPDAASGEAGSLLHQVSRAGIESSLPLLFKMMV